MHHSFDAYCETDSKVLILGSVPSQKSRELGFYYMHPKNRFWKVLSAIFQEEYPETIGEKKYLLKKHQIALWDVIKSCQIEASSDSSISDVVLNDISGLLKKTNIKQIYTTGKKAFELYQRYIFPTTRIEVIYLPSTSPANARFKESNLIHAYQIIRSETE